MTKKRSVAWMGIVVALAVMGFGCGGGSDDSSGGSTSPIVGTWTGTMGADDPADPDVTIVLTVNANNTYSGTVNGVPDDTGTWAVSGNQWTVLSDGEGNEALTVSVAGNTMTVTTAEGSIVLTRI